MNVYNFKLNIKNTKDHKRTVIHNANTNMPKEIKAHIFLDDGDIIARVHQDSNLKFTKFISGIKNLIIVEVEELMIPDTIRSVSLNYGFKDDKSMPTVSKNKKNIFFKKSNKNLLLDNNDFVQIEFPFKGSFKCTILKKKSSNGKTIKCKEIIAYFFGKYTKEDLGDLLIFGAGGRKSYGSGIVKVK